MVNLIFFEIKKTDFLLLDQSNRVRSESGTSTNETINRQRKPPMIVHYQQNSIPTSNIPDDSKSDESEVTITRL